MARGAGNISYLILFNNYLFARGILIVILYLLLRFKSKYIYIHTYIYIYIYSFQNTILCIDYVYKII